jgi:hypothetical protein
MRPLSRRKSIKLIKVIFASILALISLLVLISALAYFVEIFNTTTTGSACGFTISASQDECYQVLLKESNKFDYIWCFCANAVHYGHLVIRPENKQDIIGMSDWQIRFKSPWGVDGLELKFDKGKLIKIFRYRDLIEVP